VFLAKLIGGNIFHWKPTAIQGEGGSVSASICRHLVVIFALVLTPGCASKVYDHPAFATSETATAELTVIRKKEFGGSAVPWTVNLDGEKLVRLWTGSYAVMHVAPDSYSLTFYDAKNGTTSEVSVELEIGEQTYILLEVERVVWAVSSGASVGITSSGTSVTSSSGVAPVGIIGLHAISEVEARELMSNYNLVGSE
jgi:hypothetical protein